MIFRSFSVLPSLRSDHGRGRHHRHTRFHRCTIFVPFQQTKCVFLQQLKSHAYSVQRGPNLVAYEPDECFLRLKLGILVMKVSSHAPIKGDENERSKKNDSYCTDGRHDRIVGCVYVKELICGVYCQRVGDRIVAVLYPWFFNQRDLFSVGGEAGVVQISFSFENCLTIMNAIGEGLSVRFEYTVHTAYSVTENIHQCIGPLEGGG
mmetsp:Transcript_56409/g.136880  ORF Transcript_56409/g.136880 Transcript_56409/m.136880 type:complete len:206 (-) Transcript_56409:1141-1758(-)